MRRYFSLASGLAILLWIAGCGDTPDDPAALRDGITAARDEARAAQGRKEHKAALKAAGRAERFLAALRAISEGQGTRASEAGGMIAGADRAARAARHWADLAEEEYQLAKTLGSFRARTYRGGRKLALKAAFKGLGLAADQAAKKGINKLPQEVQDAAELAAAFASDFSGRKPLKDGSPDWAGIARDMNAFAAKPPGKLPLVLGVAFFLLGRERLAICELDMVDTSRLDAEEKLVYGFALALVYRANGWTRLSIRQIESMIDCGDEYDPEVQEAMYLFSAMLFVADKDFARADADLARALKADPNNAVAVFVTGERLAAGGEWEKAAASLEKSARECSGDEWLARQISERARQVRDGRGADQPLFYDKKFVARIVMHYLAQAAGKSAAVREVLGWVRSARRFGAGMLAGISGAGGAAQQPGTPDESDPSGLPDKPERPEGSEGAE